MHCAALAVVAAAVTAVACGDCAQVSFMTLDAVVQYHQLSPIEEVGQSQLWILV